MPHEVFISYSKQNKLAADAVCSRLEQDGVRCWIAPRSIVPGEPWAKAIIDGLNECRILVLVFSQSANKSDHVFREVERAVNKGLTIIPLRLERTKPTAALEYLMAGAHWLDALTPPLEKKLEELAQVISGVLHSEQPPSLPPTDPEGDAKFIREFEEIAPDDWNRKNSSPIGRFFKRLLDDR